MCQDHPAEAAVAYVANRLSHRYGFGCQPTPDVDLLADRGGRAAGDHRGLAGGAWTRSAPESDAERRWPPSRKAHDHVLTRLVVLLGVLVVVAVPRPGAAQARHPAQLPGHRALPLLARSRSGPSCASTSSPTTTRNGRSAATSAAGSTPRRSSRTTTSASARTTSSSRRPTTPSSSTRPSRCSRRIPGDPDYDASYPLPCAKVLGGPRGRAKAFRPASVVNVSAMSFGSLSGAAVERHQPRRASWPAACRTPARAACRRTTCRAATWCSRSAPATSAAASWTGASACRGSRSWSPRIRRSAPSRSS